MVELLSPLIENPDKLRAPVATLLAFVRGGAVGGSAAVEKRGDDGAADDEAGRVNLAVAQLVKLLNIKGISPVTFTSVGWQSAGALAWPCAVHWVRPPHASSGVTRPQRLPTRYAVPSPRTTNSRNCRQVDDLERHHRRVRVGVVRAARDAVPLPRDGRAQPRR
jgi:hypothetical protein